MFSKEIDGQIKLGMEIEVVSASRFRGLESPIIVIFAGKGSDENALLCAYTRATSRCIVIYDAVEILKGSYKTFGQILQQLDQTGDIKREASLSLTSSIVNEEYLDLIPVTNQSINLYWCSDWNSWVIVPDDDNWIAQVMWTYHLIITTDHSVCTWRAFDQGNILYFESVENITDSYPFRRYCNIDFCSECGVYTPFISESLNQIDECIICSKEKNNISSTTIEIQQKFDSILAYSSQYTKQDKQQLSIFLIALGRWNTISKKERQKFNSDMPAMTGSIGYSVSNLLILTDILKIPENSQIVLGELATKYREHWCPSLKCLIDKKTWRKIVSLGINRCIGKKMLSKVKKGVYQKTF